jgi:hypothetical protein
VEAGAQRVRPTGNQIDLVGGETLSYGYLVIAMGPDLASDEIEGLGSHAGLTQSVCHVDHSEAPSKAIEPLAVHPRTRGGRLRLSPPSHRGRRRLRRSFPAGAAAVGSRFRRLRTDRRRLGASIKGQAAFDVDRLAGRRAAASWRRPLAPQKA